MTLESRSLFPSTLYLTMRSVGASSHLAISCLVYRADLPHFIVLYGMPCWQIVTYNIICVFQFVSCFPAKPLVLHVKEQFQSSRSGQDILTRANYMSNVMSNHIKFVSEFFNKICVKCTTLHHFGMHSDFFLFVSN